ncbi:MAG TPA: PAS domain-containing protein, partial [Chitinophagaceae bacterium]|nr:PAS domain-containing protein [Chitinophagaceae bacterium]
MLHETPDSVSSNLVNFKAVFESMPGVHALLQTDAPDYTILSVTDDFLRQTNRTREELVGLGLFKAFPPNPDDPKFDGEQNMSTSFQIVIQNKKQHQLPVQRYDIKNAEGVFEESYWSAINKPVFDDTGAVMYILHSAVDITSEIKVSQREDKMKDIEKSFNLFMQAPVTIAIVKGDDYVIELANESMQKVWGRGKEVIGKPLLKAIPELEGQGFIERLDEVRKTGIPYYAYESPATILHNGKEETFYFDFVYQPYYEDINLKIATGIIGVAHDVTEQVMARKKVNEVTERLNFRNALFEAQNEVTPDGVLIVDAKGKMLLHNSRFVEIWKMPDEILESKDDNAALQHAATMLLEPQRFLDKVRYLYTNQKEKSYDLIPFKDG